MRRLIIIGDTFLDTDLHGRSDRLCPEAAVPVVDAAEEVRRPGGAGLAAMLAARGPHRTTLITALDDDAAGHQLREMLEPHVDLVALPLAGTTVRKIRIRSGGQLIARIDHGDGRAAPGSGADEAAAEALARADAVLVADYGRGMAEHPALRAQLADMTPFIPAVWDPHPKGPPPVKGMRLVTPNQSEAERLAPGAGSARLLAERLRAEFGSDAVAVTQGAQGATLATAQQTARIPAPPDIPTDTDRWIDTCGAGDRFSVAAATLLMAGQDVHRAVAGAVDAASRFVTSGGVAALERDEAARPPEGEPAANAFDLAARLRRTGGTLVATGGCFDLLHPGHVSLLRRARAMGDALVVCLNSDESVRRLKGEGRPILTAADRARVLSALSVVDAVVVFDESTPVQVLDRLRPDIWVKGGDYAGQPLPESDTVFGHGGEVVVVPTVDGYSTTKLIATVSAHA